MLEVTDSTDEKKDEDVMEVAVVEKKSTKDERTMSIVRHPDLLAAFAQYDTSLSGIMSDRDVEMILFSLGLGLTRSQVLVKSKGIDYFTKFHLADHASPVRSVAAGA